MYPSVPKPIVVLVKDSLKASVVAIGVPLRTIVPLEYWKVPREPVAESTIEREETCILDVYASIELRFVVKRF